MLKNRKIVEKDGKFYTIRGVELTRNNNTMTEKEFWSWIRSSFRRMSVYWKPKYQKLLEGRRPYQGKNKRIKWEYHCEYCNQYVVMKEIEMDHIIPCGTLKSFVEAAQFLERLLIEKNGYQRLCKTCHRKKTYNQVNLGKLNNEQT